MSPATVPAIDHASRVASLTERLPLGNGCDAIVLLDPIDVRWLTGFTGSTSWVVISHDELVLGTDGRYADRARQETAGCGARVVVEQRRGRLDERLIEAASRASRVALDPTTTSHARWGELAGALSPEPTPSLVALQRQVKDDAEIARIEAAARAAEAALADVEPLLLATVDEPMTEHDVRTELEYRMRLHGADDRAYDTIVASGPEHAARPHHGAGRRTIVAGDAVIVDVGALVDGYRSDMTRSWVIAGATDAQRELHDLVVEAQRAGLDAVRDGATAASVDAACREVVEREGRIGWYLHGAGHGVGLEIHEPPFHAPASEEVLASGMVVTVEPGLYRDGVGGVRIEDLVVVTESGHRVLTHSPKRPLPSAGAAEQP
ncbi:M24 family metallopeptidase [Ilumatobacter sp.]|uniref:M24 family metallopeptidase n=1 Tax=Ilumatobacter sp. TaxID=1967498 RepID=UPI003B52CA37